MLLNANHCCVKGNKKETRDDIHVTTDRSTGIGQLPQPLCFRTHTPNVCGKNAGIWASSNSETLTIRTKSQYVVNNNRGYLFIQYLREHSSTPTPSPSKCSADIIMRKTIDI
jgi:hypothetical protein